MFKTSPLTLEQRLQKSAMKIMAHPKWMAFGGVLMVGERRVCDRTPTAYTNGKDVVFGRQFFDNLSDAELRFVDLHEQMHKAYCHLITWRRLFEQDPQLTNVAADYFVNNLLLEMDAGEGFIKMPSVGLHDPKYAGLNVQQIFDMLLKNPPPRRPRDAGGAGDAPGGAGGGAPGDVPGGGHGGFDEHGWAEAEAMSPAERDALRQEIDGAVRSGALAAGKQGSGGSRALEELLEPQVDWRQAMADFVQSLRIGSGETSWRRINRRFIGAGLLMPGMFTETVGEWVVAVDTSGSIYGRTLTLFMSEVIAMAKEMKPERVHLLYWDTEVCAHECYEPADYDTMAATTKPAGGGCTTVECVPAFLAEKNITPQGVLVLTDGYLGGTWGQWHSPVLWCVIDNKRATPTTGKVLHINSAHM